MLRMCPAHLICIALCVLISFVMMVRRNDGEAGGEERGVANCLDYPDDKAERDEHPWVVKVVQQPEEDGACAGGEDAEVEHPAGAPCVDLGTDVGAGDEHGELKYAEYKAILCTRG